MAGSRATSELSAEVAGQGSLGPCTCWSNRYALGHGGHCCFARDDRSRRINNGFKTDQEICHTPRLAAAAAREAIAGVLDA